MPRMTTQCLTQCLTTQCLTTERVRADVTSPMSDDVIVEAPLTIQLDGITVTTTMRTPGHDFELAAGFCATEGLFGDAIITEIRSSGASNVDDELGVVTVDTGGRAPKPQPRIGPSSSSCGVCGSDAILELAERLDPLPGYQPWDRHLLMSLPERMQGLQPLFEATGAAHAAAAFDRSGTPLVVREDIGRHNAVDKVVGYFELDPGRSADGLALFVSSRASFEMVQKAWAGGFTALVAVSGPSALAVTTARRAGLTLAGFVRPGRANFYSPEHV